MRFEYRLSGLGWADGCIEINENICYFTTSYMTNALKDFLDVLVSVIPSCVPEDELKTSNTFEWYEEPAGTQWTLTRQNCKTIHIIIVAYKDIHQRLDPMIEIDAHCDIVDLVYAVVQELDILIKTHGIIGFKKCWDTHDFPLTNFLILKNYILTNNNIDIIEYEEKGCQLHKTDINKDIELLLINMEIK
ncbi:hypothetical protein OB236_08215 [Paenibacillus sp. WQ 127069]|uniref:Uncharacterized protein n=1 Tax=Paenibacillus baimaensis TaxID=2982185 RepID=A0ABT2UBV6_9BACL|nr:hypothetical protein [Paenibacillus sp. WQ 127069]MCU6792109.1 hypothetical protein [Paenibacillus sp. WQ 127069]